MRLPTNALIHNWDGLRTALESLPLEDSGFSFEGIRVMASQYMERGTAFLTDNAGRIVKVFNIGEDAA